MVDRTLPPINNVSIPYDELEALKKKAVNNNTLLLQYLAKCEELKKFKQCWDRRHLRNREVPRREGRRIAKELEDYGVFGTPPLKGLNNLLPPKVRVDYEEGGNHD